MEMDDRKRRILEAIIRDYIETGDPVGSRTISKKYNLGVSSATIRNEMADLEELGLIEQPHTSAGRVPSDKGYRLYVNHMMKRTHLKPEFEHTIEEMIKKNVTHIDELVDQTAKLLAILTSCTTIVSTPLVKQAKIKHLQLVPIDDKSVLCVIVTDANTVKQHRIMTSKALDFNMCYALTNILNESVEGNSLDQISLSKVRLSIEDKMKDYADLAGSIVEAIDNTLTYEDHPDIFIRGTNNILGFEEFENKDKAAELFKVLEEKPHLIDLISQDPTDTITIRIGEENTLTPMKDCSVLTTTYSVGNGSKSVGNIGIIGPTRMNYSQVISVLEYVSKHITSMLKELNDS